MQHQQGTVELSTCLHAENSTLQRPSSTHPAPARPRFHCQVQEVCLFVEEAMGARRGSLLAGQHWKVSSCWMGSMLDLFHVCWLPT